MKLRKIGVALLYPHISIVAVVVPTSLVLLVASMLSLPSDSPLSIVSYVLSAYALTVFCLRIPSIIAFFRRLKSENALVIRWFSDERLRVNVSLYSSFTINVVYAVFQLCLGIYHHSFWFSSLAGYYVSLAVMRWYLAGYTRRNRGGDNLEFELRKYRTCGAVFLVMNLALALMVFFMVYWNRTFVHHEITTIAMAAYTFTSLTLAIINIVRYRKYQSPVYSATKAINLAAALVSMLTLESTMLTTFGGNMDITTRRLFLAISGTVISAMIVVTAVYMTVIGTKKLNSVKKGTYNGK
jgi:hypothetical protein